MPASWPSPTKTGRKRHAGAGHRRQSTSLPAHIRDLDAAHGRDREERSGRLCAFPRPNAEGLSRFPTASGTPSTHSTNSTARSHGWRRTRRVPSITRPRQSWSPWGPGRHSVRTNSQRSDLLRSLPPFCTPDLAGRQSVMQAAWACLRKQRARASRQKILLLAVENDTLVVEKFKRRGPA